MRTRRLAVAMGVVALAVLALAQNAAKPGILKPAELKQLVPQSYFFAGRTATVQLRNAAGIRLENGKLVLAALVDTSGYSSAIKEKYQGLFINEAPVDIEGSELKPGQYGFGFVGDKFNVMDVGANDVLSVTAHRDEKLRPAVPLKIVEADAGYRLYAGKNYVTLKGK